jgi:hypothetical protein
LAACLALSLVIGGVVFVAGWSRLGAQMQKERQEPQAEAPVDRNTGTIVIVLPGNRCRQGTFDNATGRIAETGSLDCDSLGPTAGQPNTTRMGAILSAFRNR